jgi:hypothetical protein
MVAHVQVLGLRAVPIACVVELALVAHVVVSKPWRARPRKKGA